MMKSLWALVLCFSCIGLASAVEDFHSEKLQPAKAMVLQLKREQWQALSAACMTPAFYSNGQATPLLFNDGSTQNNLSIPFDTATLESFGSDAKSATAKIARTYWKKADCVFVVDSYEQSLWVVPSAALLTSPILVNPDQETLTALGVKQAFVIGSSKPAVDKVVNLTTKEDAWKLHLDLMASKGLKCDYVVMTNPHDTDDKLNTNVRWPYLSLASAPLAAYRQAIVQTGDYTGDRAKFDALGGAVGEAGDKDKYESVKPTFLKVKADSLAAEKFLADKGSMPKYLGMVGGAIELPYYILDIHTHYKYWDLEIQYVPADMPYATMRDDVDFTRLVKPDLAVGRIIGDDVQDASGMLVKTFFYREFLPGGKYAGNAPAGWQGKSVVLDGHRLNQPDEGGPAASPNEPFFPAREVGEVFTSAGLKSDYVMPKDVTKTADANLPIEQLLGKLGEYGNVQFVVHGDPPYMRIETGRNGKDLNNFLLTGPKVRQLMKFDGPTAMYVIGCHAGTCYMPCNSNAEFVPTAAVHTGAVAFIAPHTCQSICFWRYAPKGPANEQATYFWDNALNKKMPIGTALMDAKWRAYQEWKDKQYEKDRGKDTDNASEVDAPTVLLFGDPALRIGT